MKNKIKMIGVDLDGTLLTDRKDILPYTKEVLHKAAEKGIIILIATGRPFNGVPEELLSFDGIRYAMTSNGARIVDIKSGKVLYENLLSRKNALLALKIGAKYDTLQEIYYDGQGYADEDKIRRVEKYHRNSFMREYFLATRKPVESVIKLARECKKDMDKMQILFADLKEREPAWKEIEKIGGMTITDSLGYNIEINGKNVDKGEVMLEFGRRLGMKREEIMAFGDGNNDESMVKAAGFGVAMGNAVESVRAAADYVTLTNEEEGVAAAIEKFVLKGGKVC